MCDAQEPVITLQRHEPDGGSVAEIGLMYQSWKSAIARFGPIPPDCCVAPEGGHYVVARGEHKVYCNDEQGVRSALERLTRWKQFDEGERRAAALAACAREVMHAPLDVSPGAVVAAWAILKRTAIDPAAYDPWFTVELPKSATPAALLIEQPLIAGRYHGGRG